MPLTGSRPAGALIAVDVGNTSVAMGLFRGGRLVRRRAVPTGRFGRGSLKRLVGRTAGARACVVSSVVPAVNRKVREAAAAIGLKARFAGRDLPVPIDNRALQPREVGADRLVNAFSAWRLFRAPCICVDFGTAVTFDVVSGRGAYEGGAIAPGIELTLSALADRTALLPRMRRLRHPRNVVGRDTLACIRSGCAYGLGALCDGILRRIDREKGRRHRVVATGGYARFMARYTRRIRLIRPDLTLQGLAALL